MLAHGASAATEGEGTQSIAAIAKAIAERVHGRPLGRAVHTNQLEDIVVGPAGQVNHLVGEQAHIDDAEQHAPPINHRKRE